MVRGATVDARTVLDMIDCIDRHTLDGWLFKALVRLRAPLIIKIQKITIDESSNELPPTATTTFNASSGRGLVMTCTLRLREKLPRGSRLEVGGIGCSLEKCIVLLLAHEYTHMVEFVYRYATGMTHSHHKDDLKNGLFLRLLETMFGMTDVRNAL